MFNANHPLYFGNFLSKFRTILFNLHKDDSIDTRENPLRNPLLRNIHNIHYYYNEHNKDKFINGEINKL